MDIKILHSGSLLLSVEEGEREELRAAQIGGGELSALCEACEPYSCNGGYQPFDGGAGNPFVGLTDAPCIAESMSLDDDGKHEVQGRLWWFPDYAIVSPVDELVNQGKVEFPAAPGWGVESRPSARRRRSP